MSRRLTPRQLEIVDLLTRPGATQQVVADQLGISVQSVKNQLTLVYRTLGVTSIGQAARRIYGRTPIR